MAATPAYIWNLTAIRRLKRGRMTSQAEGALPAQFLIPFIVATAVAVLVAHHLARLKNRPATGWMWAAALFPPAVVLLALLPSRAARSGAVA
jgi:hypothetical protein